MGLSAALATAGRSLELATAGIQVAGQNLANANTPGYIREELKVQPNLPYLQGNLIFGTGAYAVGVQQQIDVFLERRIHTANTEFHSVNVLQAVYRQLEGTVGALGEADLSSALNRFLGAIHDAISEPESAALRTLVVQQGEQFAQDVSALRIRVDDLRHGMNGQVDTLAEEANLLIRQIADLNAQITRIESAGLLQSDAGSLRSLRYEALNRLSEIVPTRFTEGSDGAVTVFAGSDYLVMGDRTQQLKTVGRMDQGMLVSDVALSETGSNISRLGGELGGVIQGRDAVLGGFVADLDALAAAVIFEFNRIHASGEGTARLESVTGTYRVQDANAALNTAGLDFTPQHGSFQVKVVNAATGIAETTTIAVDLDGIGGDTSLEDLRAALDAVANLSATITTDGRLSLSTGEGYEFVFADDTSGVLAAMGINTFFTGKDSGDIGVNAVVRNDPRYFASGQGGGPADNRNAVLLAQFTETPSALLKGASIDGFYETMITRLAQDSASHAAIAEGRRGFRDALLAQREQFSGVSLDEEALRVFEYQRAYQASARLIGVIDELFATLLNI